MINKKKFVLPVVLSALGILIVSVVFFAVILPKITAAKPILQPASGIQVNPIDGLKPDFIMGADVSMLAQIEASGGKYYVNGVEQDCLKILKDHGVNWVRLRIWNNPTDKNEVSLGGGNNDLQKTVEIAKRAKAMGFKFLLDFHYSDWWADPGKQNKPKAWEGLNSDQLQQAVYDYTAQVIQALNKAGAMPDMVEIGNEVNDGMIWPDGKINKQGSEKVGGYDGFANLLIQGIKAVRDNDPRNNKPEKRTRILIHLANGGDNKLYRTVFDALTARNVDFDVIGLSYYSYWHGPLDQLKANMNDISERYHKDVVIAETAYAFTSEDADGHGNLFGEGAQNSGGYKATPQGQATAMHDFMEALAQVPNSRGLGMFYWEPDWIPVEGAGWKTGEGNAWENQAMFDFKGNALPSINVFNLVRPKKGSVPIPASLTGFVPVDLKTHIDQMPELPAAVQAFFSDDSIRNMAVQWASIGPVQLGKDGSFTIKGAVDGTDLMAVANIVVNGERSFLENAGFETGDFTSWVVEGNTDAVDVSSEAQNVNSGTYVLHYWLNDPFTFTLSQKITGLKNGSYTLSVWIQGGGGEESIQLFASGYGGDPLTVDIKNRGWQQWQNPAIQEILVTNGECTVGLKVVAKAGNWAFIDDLEFVPKK
jgi:arabinogalactan endo-1,4-beta-galactosidase